MTEDSGPLELFHPTGVARRAMVLGEACPERLRPIGTAGEPPYDLIVLAPSRRESESPDWVARAGRAAAASLAPDGLAYLLAPRAARRPLVRAMVREGLEVAERVLHQPDLATSDLLFPLRRRTMRGAATRLLAPGARRRGLSLALGAPGAVAALGRMHHAVGLVLRRPSASALAGWLGSGGSGMDRLAAIQTRYRADRTTSAVHLLGNRESPAAVVKVVLRAQAGGDRVRAEAGTLADLGPAARAAGVAVPTASVIVRGTATPALRLDLIPGVAAARLLAGQPGRGDHLLRRVGEWLERWSRATAVVRPLDRALLDLWVLGPLGRLRGQLDDPAYAGWLEARCRDLEGRSVPLVAAHNDLTMANVLVSSDGGLGVIDWESAERESLPLRDCLYAMVDLRAAQGRYRDRAAAFEQCFGSARGDGISDEALARVRQAVELPGVYATLAFHACWLQHADNERRKRAPGEPLPFLGYARRAAALRLEL